MTAQRQFRLLPRRNGTPFSVCIRIGRSFVFDDDPQPKALIIKRVCDFADNEKSDKYQKFAAYTSCEFAKLMYEKYLPL